MSPSNIAPSSALSLSGRSSRASATPSAIAMLTRSEKEIVSASAIGPPSLRTAGRQSNRGTSGLQEKNLCLGTVIQNRRGPGKDVPRAEGSGRRRRVRAQFEDRSPALQDDLVGPAGEVEGRPRRS